MWLVFQKINPCFQSKWDRSLYTLQYQKLLSSVTSDTEKARILGLSSEHASDWLHATPISSLGLKLSDTSLRAICAVRLGSPLCQVHTLFVAQR